MLAEKQGLGTGFLEQQLIYIPSVRDATDMYMVSVYTGVCPLEVPLKIWLFFLITVRVLSVLE